MKTKIIGILVCMLLIAVTVLPVTGTISKRETSPLMDEIDQCQEQVDECVFFESGAWQEFVPTKTTLTKVELHVGNYFSGSYPLTMTIEAPLGTPLVDKTLTASEIPLDYCDWTVFDVDDTTLTPGHGYYIVLTYDPGCEYCWSGAWEDQYPQGDSSEGYDWDWCFRTFGEEDTEDWELEIKVKGSWLGYGVTVTNVGNEPVSGDLTIEITTDAWVMLAGDKLGETPDVIEPQPGESIEFNMQPVLGFGPATILISGTFETPDVYPFETTADGFVLLIYISCDATPIHLP